jgi:secreted PhoX family phosphatase
MRHVAGSNARVNPSGNTPFRELVSRRGLLAGLGAAGALVAVPAQAQPVRSGLGFKEVPHGLDEKDHVPEGYERQVLIRWGDPVAPGAPPFDVNALSAAAQEKQFGYNCDFIGYLPLPAGGRSSSHGLLGVNHEYTNPELMFAGLTREKRGDLNADQCAIELAAHGFTVIEVKREAGQWKVVADSKYARRFSMASTEFRIAGPAAGHARLKTKADPSGTKAIGTLNNCAGGVTPWGTFLCGEENFHFYFTGKPEGTPETANHLRLGVTGQTRVAWGKHIDRFNIEKEPNEPNRFGWVVEIDPYDAKSVPVKRTALGRIKHEGATIVIAPDGRIVAYTSDDQIDEYVYRFVSKGTFDPKNRAANMRLLDEGTLSVARFDADGTVSWLPLVHGRGPLTAANGFRSQADVVIDARRAADLLGATPMDRPEDVETDPATGRVYVMCTGNRDRKKVNAANLRAPNLAGHVIELTPPGGAGPKADHTAAKFRWSVFLQAGDPKANDGAKYGQGMSENGWLAWPDNCAFDGKGRIWIATDGMPTTKKVADGVFVADILGPARAATKRFYAAPKGAEVCGPCFTPDNATLFLAIQHPGEETSREETSNFEQPATRWPDFKDGMPPRPSVIAIVKKGGGTIGS